MEKSELLIGLSLLLVSYSLIEYFKNEDRPIVEIENGRVRGIYSFSSDSARKYKAFMGIPFAKASRFEAPEPADNWDDIRDASFYRSQCIAVDVLFSGLQFGEESCLFINVFIPLIKNRDPEKLSVMVFIHGGYWHVGSSQDQGEKRMMEKDIILVTFNYRLGALGFLSTGDEEGVRGNMGLKDQVMALKWVQRNIKYFGGNPDQVTIFGESVGGVSVHLHILSKMSKGLFNRAISQSGNALSSFGTYRKVKIQARRFAKKLNCPTENIKLMVQCLKGIDAWKLVSVHKEAFDVLRERQSMFAPTIEFINDTDAFLTEEPLTLLERGDFALNPWITGINAHEGKFITAGLYANKAKAKIVKNYKVGLPRIVHYLPNDDISEKIQNAYFGDLTSNTSEEDYFLNLTNLISDRQFNYPTSKSAGLHSKHAPVYLYYFNYNSYHSLEYFFTDAENYFVHPAVSLLVNHVWRFIKEFIFRIPVINDFVVHGNELSLFWTHPWSPSFFSWLPQRDLPISRNIINLWTSFAQERSTLIFDKVTWEPIDPKNRTFKYLEISLNPSMIDEPFADRMKFWNKTYSSLEES